MAKRDPQPGGSARSRQRGKPVQVVQPKTPWGAILGGGVLGLLLIGIVAYAVLNTGSGFVDPLERADTAIEGVAVADEETLTRNHVAGPVDYDQNPPNGGDHNAVPQTCAVYDEPIASEHAVHSLEHGAAWITYRPDLPEDEVAELRRTAEGRNYVLMSPFPEQSSPVNVSAWGRRLSVESASDDRIADFLSTYANGPQTPEKGALCAGVTTTGPLQAQPAAPAPQATVEVPSG